MLCRDSAVTGNTDTGTIAMYHVCVGREAVNHDWNAGVPSTSSTAPRPIHLAITTLSISSPTLP